jgi:hypothetical protein
VPLPLNASAEFGVSALRYTNADGTNIYYNIIFVNTNFADTNLSAAWGFTGASYIQVNNLLAPNDPNGYEDIVQFSEPVVDITTGDTVTNAVYLIDNGAYLGLISSEDNSGSSDGWSRPNAFEVTTEEPSEWDSVQPGNYYYAYSNVYAPGEFKAGTASTQVPYVAAEYGVQIGHNVEDPAGSFEPLIQTETSSNFVTVGTNTVFTLNGLLSLNRVNLPDPTNNGGRVEITAANLDATQTRMRAEGMVILNVTNLVGGSTEATDYGEYNANLGVTNGSLVVSNFFPSVFHRVRGDIYAWSASWQNLQTNSVPAPFGTTNTSVTNQIHYHVLVVDQNLFGTFNSTARNLAFTGSNSIVVQDDLNIINGAVFYTTNLTINGTATFGANAASFTPANTPYLKNLFVNTNGTLYPTNVLDVGYNLTKPQSGPTGRKYTVNSITNFGYMVSTAPLLESSNFENDGILYAPNSGSIVVEADNLGLGQALAETNYVYAEGNVTLSANFIYASNSYINAGYSSIGFANNSLISVVSSGLEAGTLTLDAPEVLTDFVPGVGTTNTNSPIMNTWFVTGGFALPVKPASGDLFGTKIVTVGAGYQRVTHVWAGADRGATAAGFTNNVVIGRLVMDRQTNTATLQFSAAGTKNAMYVDYLELDDYSYNDYRNGLVIDPNMTIYFADSNFDPMKLMEVYPNRLVWVSSFAGPNSTAVVPYLNSSNVCLMNAALADSFDVGFFGVANHYNQPYVLNNPTNANAPPYPCPGEETTDRELLVSSAGGDAPTLLTIGHTGDGKITPVPTKAALGGKYTLTATPAAGWMFEGWSTSGLAGNVNTNSSVLRFTLVSNTFITANFAAKPFTLTKGVYNGLFYQTNQPVDPGSSGGFTLTLAAAGTFSGRLLMGPNAYTFNSKFSTAGLAQGVPARHGANSLTVNLKLDMSGVTGQITGDVQGETWDAPLRADIAPVWTAKNHSPLKGGKFTVSLPWDTGTVAESGGDGYGVATVSATGELTLAGALADGASYSRSAPISTNSEWPFYAYAAAKKDTVLGWVSVSSSGLTGTNISWSKPAGSAPLYESGFTNYLQITSSPWAAPGRKSEALDLPSPVVTLTGDVNVTTNVTLKNYLSYTATNLSLTIRPSTGVFTGWFDNPVTGRKETMTGVVLQDASSARGFFLESNYSGAVLLRESQ